MTFLALLAGIVIGIAGTSAYAHNYPEKFNKSVKEMSEEIKELKEKM